MKEVALRNGWIETQLHCEGRPRGFARVGPEGEGWGLVGPEGKEKYGYVRQLFGGTAKFEDVTEDATKDETEF